MSYFKIQPLTVESYIYTPYAILSEIYEKQLDTLSKYKEIYNLQLKEETRKTIQEKLDKIKALENELSEIINNEKLKRDLQIASKGYIDPSKIPDEYLKDILSKHSNLLGLTSTYSNKISNLVNALQKINSILAERTGYKIDSISIKIQ